MKNINCERSNLSCHRILWTPVFRSACFYGEHSMRIPLVGWLVGWMRSNALHTLKQRTAKQSFHVECHRERTHSHSSEAAFPACTQPSSAQLSPAQPSHPTITLESILYARRRHLLFIAVIFKWCRCFASVATMCSCECTKQKIKAWFSNKRRVIILTMLLSFVYLLPAWLLLCLATYHISHGTQNDGAFRVIWFPPGTNTDNYIFVVFFLLLFVCLLRAVRKFRVRTANGVWFLCCEFT